MRLLKRILAILIIFSIISSTIPQVLELVTQKAFAATAGKVTVNIATDSSTNWLLNANSVTLTWQQVTGAASYDLTYFDIKNNTPVTQTIAASVSDAVYQIDGLETDFAYNFIVKAKNSSNTIISTNNRQVITGTSMDVTPIYSDAQKIPAGGIESGNEPKLNFRIKIPETSTYDLNSDTWSTVSDFAYNKIDYDIVMDNNVGGTNLDKIKVRYSNKPSVNQYIATTYIDNQVLTVANQVYTGDLESGYMNFTVTGENSDKPTDIAALSTNSTYNGAESGFYYTSASDNNTSEDIGKVSSVSLENIMRDVEITPSMAIKMSIIPIVHDTTDSNIVLTIPTTVSGGFTSTPIKFQINKDSSNNMIITILRINEGTSFKYSLISSSYKSFPTNNVIASRSDSDSSTNTLKVYVEKQSANSTTYYKVNASDSSGDLLSSGVIGYSPSDDSPIAPLPEGLKVLSVTQTSGAVTDTFYNKDSTTHDVKSADVKLIWAKPTNYSELYSSMSSAATVEDAVYYHIMISSFSDGGNIGDKENINAMFGDILNPTKTYTVTNPTNKGYREIYKIDLTACTVVDSTGAPTANGGYLSYTIKGLNLFSKTTGFASPVLAQPSVSETQDLTMNTDSYPTYLLPNRIYYAKMYTSKGTAASSDNSLAVSFTTPLDGKKSPPVPINFKLMENKIDSSTSLNYVKMEWSKINFNLSDYTSDTAVSSAVYYDLYINNSMDTSTFKLVGTGEQTTGDSSGDAAFSGLPNVSTVIDATVSQFTDSTLTGTFGSALSPNTIYYFAVKTWVMIGDVKIESPGYSQILTVTTTKGGIQPPNTGGTTPKAPQDLKVAVDASGNKVMDSTSVTLTWNKLESDVKYILIQTATKIDSNITLDSLTNQGIPYTALLDTPGKDESDQDGSTFIYDSTKTKFTYKATGLTPNTVYYFSLMAVRTDSTTNKTINSIWISIPVTTSLIEAPSLLNVVTDHEVGIWWDASGNDTSFTAENFTIKYYENSSTEAVTVSRSKMSISKEITGTNSCRFFARITGLKKNSAYSFEISGHRDDSILGSLDFTTKDIDSSNVGNSSNPMNLSTRESMHEIDVSWEGPDEGNFQLAIKGETDTDYTLLSEKLSEFYYTSKEKPSSLVGTNYTMYYARIKTTDGTTKLKSNSKYYIKVRSVQVDSSTGVQVQSKFIGPVNTRTEFSKSDYDDNDQTNSESANYADRVKKYKDTLYWEMGNDSGIYKIKMRKDKVENLIKNSSSNSFVIDLTSTSRTDTITDKIIYVPITTIRLLATKGENLIVRVPGAELVYKPGTIDLANNSLVTDVVNNSNVKETYLYFEINKLSSPSGDLPSYSSVASDIQSLSLEARGTYISDEDAELAINAKLNSLIAAGLGSLQGVDKSLKKTSDQLDAQINSIISNLDSTLKNYVRDYIEGNSSTGYSSQIADSNGIPAFSNPLSVKMTINSSVKGTKAGYVYNNSEWLLKTSAMSNSTNSVTFSTLVTGDYTVLSSSSEGVFNVPDGHWAAKDIDAFTSKYDVRDVFQGEYYANIDSEISVNATVLVLEKVLSQAGKSSSSSVIANKAKELGLDGTTSFTSPSRSLTRQDLAALLMRVYKLKTGIDTNSMKSSKTIIINDESSISSSHYKEVEMSIDMKILSLDSKLNFRPSDSCTKAQMISSLTRLLRILGELT